MEGPQNRKEWIESRLRELAEIFAVSVGGYSVLDNHLHLLVRLDPEVAGNWSDEEVVRRWGRLFPPRDKSRQPLPLSDDWVQGHLLNSAWITRARQRLQSLSWFMKCLEGMIEGFPLGNYLLLVDYSSRLYREGKAGLSREVAEILDRLGSSADQWQARQKRLRQGDLLGRFFATTRQRLREVGQRLGLRRVPNVGGCPAS